MRQSLTTARGATFLAAQKTITMDVLSSQSGALAISKTTPTDTWPMLIAEQNAKGGLLGQQPEAVVVDPATDWPLLGEKAPCPAPP